MHYNGRLAPMSSSDPCPNLAECLHVDDVKKALPAEVPDSSTPVGDELPPVKEPTEGTNTPA